MNKDTMTHSSRKSYWLRCVLPVIALGLIILNLVYLTNSTDDADSTVTVKGDAYEYPMYDITLVFGDSITQLGYEPETGGWVTHLSNMYVRRMDILNRGFSGYNTTRAKDVAHTVFPVRRDYRLAHSAGGQGSVSAVAEWLLKGVRAITGMETKKDKWSSSMWPRSDPPFPKFYPKVQLCILFFGANDAADPRDDRHTPLEEYPSNLRYIINMLRDPDSANYSPGTRIVLITPPAVGEKMSEEHFRRYGWTYGPHNNTVTHRYAEAAIQVAKDLDIPYIDMWTAIEKRVQESRKQRPVEPCEDNGYDGYDEFLSDGLHLNAKGNLLLFRTLAGTIERNWPELCPHGRSVVA